MAAGESFGSLVSGSFRCKTRGRIVDTFVAGDSVDTFADGSGNAFEGSCVDASVGDSVDALPGGSVGAFVGDSVDEFVVGSVEKSSSFGVEVGSRVGGVLVGRAVNGAREVGRGVGDRVSSPQHDSGGETELRQIKLSIQSL